VTLTGEAGRLHAATGIRDAILAGEMAPGQRLVEDELASTYGATRASVRAALIDLTAEGLVERVPNRGARVRVVKKSEAIEITECRMVLESLCAAKAAERITPEQTAELKELASQLQRAVQDAEPLRYSELNRRLHQMVIDISGQETAKNLLERLNGQLVRHRFRLSLKPGRPQRSLPEHLAIIDAIISNDPYRAEQAAREHLSSVIRSLREDDDDPGDQRARG
jgi:DNA-binding GntR family transcriptional regulator